MSPPRTNPARARRIAIRVGGVLVWSAFLSAALATMVCFAFVDPMAFSLGTPPAWWGSRMQVYAVGFFFFWSVGFTAAGLAWYLAHGRRVARR
jgi:hypothetical protein